MKFAAVKDQTLGRVRPFRVQEVLARRVWQGIYRELLEAERQSLRDFDSVTHPARKDFHEGRARMFGYAQDLWQQADAEVWLGRSSLRAEIAFLRETIRERLDVLIAASNRTKSYVSGMGSAAVRVRSIVR